MHWHTCCPITCWNNSFKCLKTSCQLSVLILQFRTIVKCFTKEAKEQEKTDVTSNFSDQNLFCGEQLHSQNIRVAPTTMRLVCTQKDGASCLRSPWLQLDVVLFLQPSAATCVPCHSLCYSVHLKIAGFLLAARCTKHRINGGLTSEVCSPTGSAASVSLPPHDTPKGPSWCPDVSELLWSIRSKVPALDKAAFAESSGGFHILAEL